MVIFTDALSVLNKLQTPRQKDLNEAETVLVDLAARTSITMQWIPAHCGTKGHEQTDRLGREGGQLDQEDRYTSYTDEKTISKTLTEKKKKKKKKRKQQHSNFNQSDSLHKLNRPEQVILFRMRLGLNRLNAHMNKKVKVGESEICPCNSDLITAERVLQHCQLHDALRRDMWPEPMPLRDKLYGSMEELRKTAAFVRVTGISV